MKLIKEAHQLYIADDDLEVSITSNVFAIDATTIDPLRRICNAAELKTHYSISQERSQQ